MADISICAGKGCPIKHSCYRFTAKPCPYMQTYGLFEFKKDGGCSHYWPNGHITLVSKRVYRKNIKK